MGGKELGLGCRTFVLVSAGQGDFDVISRVEEGFCGFIAYA